MNSHTTKPRWLKVKLPTASSYKKVKSIIRNHSLHTICESGNCPNIGECWGAGTATFMILGNICTRSCGFCNVLTGKPLEADISEPKNIANSIKIMKVKHAVITSVDRDDLPDGGAFIFAECIRQIRKRNPECKIEVLIPDFGGNWTALEKVMMSKPDTLNHNIETVRRIFKRVRPKGDYDLSLELLARAKSKSPLGITKSGVMVGLGETWGEIIQTMKDLRLVDCDLLTIGQYLRPSQKHVPLSKWYTPEEFNQLRQEGESLGFVHVASGPLVRSSYHADEQHEAAYRRAGVDRKGQS